MRVWRSLYGYAAIVVSFCSWRRLVGQRERPCCCCCCCCCRPLMAVLCRVHTTQTSCVIYDELALVRFTRSVRPSVHCALFGLPSPPAGAGSPGYRWARDSRPGPARPGPAVSGWLGLCDACKRRNNARCRKFIARGVEMKIERVLTDRQTDRPGRLRVEMPPRRRGVACHSFAAATERAP